MAAANRRDLYLQVSGNIDGLTAAMKAGRSVVNEFGAAADATAEEVRKAFSSLGGDSVEQSARQVERAYTKTFAAIRANAQSVANAPTGNAAIQIIDTAAAQQAARAAENQAAGLRLVADAAQRAAVATQGDATAAHVYATAAEAAAIGAEREATALRNQATVLQGVQAALPANTAAVARSGQQLVVSAGQQRQGVLQLGEQFRQFATEVSLGINPVVAFTQQSGQAAFALTNFGGKLGAVGTFMAGPFGTLALVAIGILGNFAVEAIKASNAVEEGVEKLKKDAEATEIARLAKEAFGKTEAGVADNVHKLTDELNKQNDALKTNAERMNIAAKRDLDASQRDRAKIAADLAAARTDLQDAKNGSANGGTAGGGTNLAALTYAQGKVDKLEARLKNVDEAITGATAAYLRSRADIADEAAKRAQDPAALINRKYDGSDGLIEKAKARLTAENATTFEMEKQLAVLRAQQKTELDAAAKAKSAASKRGNNNQLGRDVTVSEATAIVSSIGGRVTSGLRSHADQERIYADKLAGRHDGPVAKPGTSDHERGQAIDIAYGPGITIANIREAFAKQGVALRQILDEPAQKVFHVAFGKKGPSQEIVDKQAEAASQKRIRDDEAYTQLKARAQQNLLDAIQQQATTIEGAADLDAQMVVAEQQRLDSAAQAGVAEKRWTQAKADELKDLNKASADLKVAGIRERERIAIGSRQLEIDRDDLEGQISLLSLQGDLATTAKDRRRIALQILDLQEREARATLENAIAAEKDPLKKADLNRQLHRQADTHALRVDQMDRQNAGPIDQYRQQLHQNVDDVNSALEGVGVHAFQGLESDMESVINGTESVGDAFKKMASSIIADLARIALEKALVAGLDAVFPGSGSGLSALFGGGKAGGGKIEGKAVGGRISGPGNGTSDSILALIDGQKPLLVSNGESIVTAAATARYWPLIDAMNKGTLPAFATGGVVGNVRLPQLPDVRAVANDVYSRPDRRIAVDLHAKIDASPEFDVKMQSVATRTVGAAAEPIMAGATSRTMRQLSRPDLPGGIG